MEKSKEKMPDRASEDYNEKMIELLESELESLRKENENLRSVMVAAAEEIKAHWQAHCGKEGYGPSNLLHRLEKGIPAQYRYTAGAFAELEAQLKEKQDTITKLTNIITSTVFESSPKEQPEAQKENVEIRPCEEWTEQQNQPQPEHLRTPEQLCEDHLKETFDLSSFKQNEIGRLKRAFIAGVIVKSNEPQPEQAEVKCQQCEGRGNLSKSQNEYIECDWCHGSGVIVCEQQPEAQQQEEQSWLWEQFDSCCILWPEQSIDLEQAMKIFTITRK